MADNIKFKDAFIICNVIAEEIRPAVIETVTPAVRDEHDNIIVPAVTKEIEPAVYAPKLDIPFPIYHQTIVEGNKNHYCYLTPDLIGKEVLVYAHVAIADEPKAKAFPGYIGNKWKDCTKENKVPSTLWTLTREDAYAQWIANPDGSSSLQKYDGADKNEIVHPYLVEDVK